MDVPDDLIKSVESAGQGRYIVRNLVKVADTSKPDVEVVVIGRNSLITKEFFDEMPNIKLVQTISAGVDSIDFSILPNNVVLCSNAGAYRESMAEHVFAMVLSLGKNLIRNHERLHNGLYQSAQDGIYLGGKTIGIIGAGGIGRSVARVAKGFQMRTIGINTSGRPIQNFDEVWTLERLDDVLGQSDVLVISLPLTTRTRQLIGVHEFSLMKENCILVNVARGAIISQEALYSHLKTHPMFGAGIDVWWKYPKKGEKFILDFPFFELPNFLASPHNAEGVPESKSQGQEHAFANVMMYMEKGSPERVVDRTQYIGLRPTTS